MTTARASKRRSPVPLCTQMTTSITTVLAVGAAGPAAGLVVPELARRGVKVRGLVRDPRQADAVRRAGAAEVAVGDLHDRAGLDAALKGMDAVFYIAPAFMADEAETGQRFVAAAQRAGVRRIVFSSVIYPSLGALVNHAAKAPVEEAILTSGLEYTFLQPALFFQNLTWSWPRVVQTGVFAEPWSTETRFARVDYREVAEAAAIALTTDRLLFGTYELCAEGNLNRHDVAAVMSKVLGRQIKAAKAHREPADPPAGQQAAMQRMFEWYDTHGLPGNPLVLRSILGREPKTLPSFLMELLPTQP